MNRSALISTLAWTLLAAACSSVPRTTDPRTVDTRVAATPAAAPRSSLDAVQFSFATFRNIEQSVEGGVISRVSFAERSGDASFFALTHDSGDLAVRGQFLAVGRSAYAGIGVLVNAPGGTFDAGGYRVLRLRLAVEGGAGTLRIRLVGPDAATQLSGCYPVVQQAVTAQTRVYDIPLASFAPEAYCGARGVPAKKALQQLDGIEIVDAVSPVRARPVSFRVGALSLQS